MKTPGTRIKALRKELNLRQEDIARKIGVSAVAVGNWERGDNEPSGPNLTNLAKALKSSPDFIIHGTHEVRQPAAIYDNVDITASIPVLSLDVASKLFPQFPYTMLFDTTEHLKTTLPLGIRAFAIRAKGDSMLNPYGSPSIPDGAIVTIEPDQQPRSGDIVLAKFPKSNEIMLKQYVIDGPIKYLKPLNPQYRTIEIVDNCVLIGVAKKMEMLL